MKLQIKSHSIRFRITAEELQELSLNGRLVCETRVPQPGGDTATLHYGVQYSSAASSSELEISPLSMNLVLSEPDFNHLTDPANQSVYIRREYSGDNEKMIRFLTYIEKDMKTEKIKKHKSHKTNRDKTATHDSGEAPLNGRR